MEASSSADQLIDLEGTAVNLKIAAFLYGVGVEKVREGLFELCLLFNLIRVHKCLIINWELFALFKKALSCMGHILRLLPC